MKKEVTLAIDCAVGNGSLSIWNEEREIDSLKGRSDLPISKNLLKLITRLLRKNQNDLRGLKEIIYTNGPGSYTSLRVCISSVLGLKKALNIPIYPISVFQSYTTVLTEKEDFSLAILLTKNKVAIQSFVVNEIGIANSGKTKFLNLTVLIKRLSDRTENMFVTQELGNILEESITKTKNLFRYNTIPASDNESKLLHSFFIKHKKLLTKNENYFPIYQSL